MMDRWSEPRQSGEMLGYAVTHVALEAVAGMCQSQPPHQTIARYLGDDRRRRDGGDDGIATDDRLAIATSLDPVAAVDEDQQRPHRQRRHRARQRPQRS